MNAIVRKSMVSLVTALVAVVAEPSFANGNEFSLKCWDAYVDAEGRWQMGSEAPSEDVTRHFSGATDQSVCTNFTQSGGSVGELFSPGSYYCKCSISEAAPAPAEPVAIEFRRILFALPYRVPSGHGTWRHTLSIFTQRGVTELSVENPSSAELHVLRQCALLAGTAAFRPNKRLTFSADADNGGGIEQLKQGRFVKIDVHQFSSPRCALQ